MTSFLKSTGAAKEQSTVVFLHRAQEQLVGDGGSYHSKVGFKDLRQKPTKYSTLSHAKGQFVIELARLLKNNSPTTRRPSRRTEVQARGAIGIIQPVNEAGRARVGSQEIQGRALRSFRETILGCSPVSDKRSNFKENQSPARKP